MQERATAAIYGPRVIGSERHDVTRHARWVVEIDVGQTFPASADADNLACELRADEGRAGRKQRMPQEPKLTDALCYCQTWESC